MTLHVQVSVTPVASEAVPSTLIDPAFFLPLKTELLINTDMERFIFNRSLINVMPTRKIL